MNEILIINWELEDLLITCSNLVSSLIEKDSTANISILIPKSHDKFAQRIPAIKNIHLLDYKKMKAVLNNRLYFHAHGINYIESELAVLKETKWSQIINLSKNEFPKLVASYLDTDTKIGSFNELEGPSTFSNAWSFFDYNIDENLPTSPFHRSDIGHLITELDSNYGGIKIKTLPSHNENAHKNITQLRSSKDPAAKVIGINLIGSNMLDKQEKISLQHIIQQIYADNLLIPLIIVSSNSHEKNYAKSLRDEIGHGLYTVETDQVSLPSVLINIDILFSYNLHSRCVADLTETPSLIIFKEFNQILHLGPTIDESLSIINNGSVKSLSAFILSSLKSDSLKGNHDVIAYRSVQSKNGTEYIPVTEHSVTESYLNYFFSRSYLIKKLAVILDEKSIDNMLGNVPKSYIQKFCKKEKNKMTEVLKNILQTLRLLKQVNGSVEQKKSFLMQLESLLEMNLGQSPIIIPLSYFKLELESLQSKNFNENLTHIETFLFVLKSEIQNLNQLMIDIESMALKRFVPQHTNKHQEIQSETRL